jgi:hypothetical protein
MLPGRAARPDLSPDGLTLGFQVIHGRGLQTGVEVAMPCAHVARWREGLCHYLKVYMHREDALEDMGVTEETLKPLAA